MIGPVVPTAIQVIEAQKDPLVLHIVVQGKQGAPFAGISYSPPLYIITNTYSTSGAILPTDDVSVVNSASAATMTLAAGPSDGHGLLVKRVGAGAVTITAILDGISSSIVADSTTIKESVMLAWSSSLGTWLIL